jgi:hypothetical protein
MLTEEMLAALIQALKGVHRLILIGEADRVSTSTLFRDAASPVPVRHIQQRQLFSIASEFPLHRNTRLG